MKPLRQESPPSSDYDSYQKKPAVSWLYLNVRDLLAGRIASGELATGAVLHEARLSAQLAMSRAPVRRALAMLVDEGLIRPASGQGYIVGQAAEASLRLTSRELQGILSVTPDRLERRPSWEAIFTEVAHDVTACMPFGTYRVLETELGNHYQVSRTITREVLWRLNDRRLIEKDRKSHWVVGQLNARDLAQTIEMRAILEPEALLRVAGGLDPDWLRQVKDRVVSAMADLSHPQQIDQIEQDLFVTLFAGLKNTRHLGTIRRNQISLEVSRLFRQHFPLIDDLGNLQHYEQILIQLLAGHVDIAQLLLGRHYTRLERLCLARLRVLAVLPPPDHIPYLSAVT